VTLDSAVGARAAAGALAAARAAVATSAPAEAAPGAGVVAVSPVPAADGSILVAHSAVGALAASRAAVATLAPAEAAPGAGVAAVYPVPAADGSILVAHSAAGALAASRAAADAPVSAAVDLPAAAIAARPRQHPPDISRTASLSDLSHVNISISHDIKKPPGRVAPAPIVARRIATKPYPAESAPIVARGIRWVVVLYPGDSHISCIIFLQPNQIDYYITLLIRHCERTVDK